MQGDVLQGLPGPFMIAAQLGTAIGVGKGIDSVDTAAIAKGSELLDQVVGDTVDTADRRDDPDFVADADLAVGAAIDLQWLRILPDKGLRLA